ncbi:SDR family oxidoreductase [Anaerobacillus sp. CMMVII]|uniref:SDR family oxidoreductase n=1 Tax=Anaerobacillus sp. CMMVII TaxID=2755588 RepID=UPI0021B732D5|nr:SDR family oxidoreductase [Anaerobacillus sp. CMMVII]MCT8140317.1 SDR family oxidoreductase [Anaerobacillus sp. CMMVII]
MSGSILVTGATGNIGYHVVLELAAKKEKIRVAVRNPKKEKETFAGLEVDLVEFDFLNPDTYEKALEGVKKVFLIRPPQLAKPKQEMQPFINLLIQKKIEQIVFVSLMGVEKNPIVPHRKIEDMIRESGIAYTFLRPGFFMQNLNTTHREDIAVRNELFMPVGFAKTSFIDTRDIASVAAVCLTEDGHLWRSYTLTGNKAIDYYEVAEILSKTLERKIEYKNPGIFEFRRTIIKRGTKKEFANVMTMLYVLTRLGTAEKVTSEVEKILRRPPISFEQYAKDYQNDWSEETCFFHM